MIPKIYNFKIEDLVQYADNDKDRNLIEHLSKVKNEEVLSWNLKNTEFSKVIFNFIWQNYRWPIKIKHITNGSIKINKIDSSTTILIFEVPDEYVK